LISTFLYIKLNFQFIFLNEYIVPFGQFSAEPAVSVVLTQKYLNTLLGTTNPSICRISDLSFLGLVSSVSWKIHPRSSHPLRHPVVGFSSPYNPFGQLAEAVKPNHYKISESAILYFIFFISLLFDKAE
jgi:hypothetical protein